MFKIPAPRIKKGENPYYSYNRYLKEEKYNESPTKNPKGGVENMNYSHGKEALISSRAQKVETT